MPAIPRPPRRSSRPTIVGTAPQPTANRRRGSGTPTVTGVHQQPTTRGHRGGSAPHGGTSHPAQSPRDRARNNPDLLAQALGDISQPLTGDALVGAAQTLTDREFAPLLSDIGRQEAATQRNRAEQQNRAAGYYGTIAGQQGATLAGQLGANAASVQGAAGRTAGTLGAIDAQGAAARATAAHDASVRGADVAGGSLEQMAADQAAAKMRASTEGQSAQDSAQSTGDAQAAFLRGTAAATAQAGGETQGQIGARGDNALADLAASRAKLNADRKGTFTDTVLKMRQNEVDRSLTERGLANDQEKALLDFKQQMATLKSKAQIEKANRDLKVRLTGMGLDAKAAQAEADRATQEAIAAGHDATSTANTATTSATSAANNAATNATSAANNAATNATSTANNRRNNANGGAGGFTHKSRVDAAGKRDDAIGMAQSYKKSRASRDTALQLLTEKYGSDYARVAVGAIYDGGAKPHLDALLAQRYGIHVPGKYRTR